MVPAPPNHEDASRNKSWTALLEAGVAIDHQLETFKFLLIALQDRIALTRGRRSRDTHGAQKSAYVMRALKGGVTTLLAHQHRHLRVHVEQIGKEEEEVQVCNCPNEGFPSRAAAAQIESHGLRVLWLCGPILHSEPGAQKRREGSAADRATHIKNTCDEVLRSGLSNLCAPRQRAEE